MTEIELDAIKASIDIGCGCQSANMNVAQAIEIIDMAKSFLAFKEVMKEYADPTHWYQSSLYSDRNNWAGPDVEELNENGEPTLDGFYLAQKILGYIK